MSLTIRDIPAEELRTAPRKWTTNRAGVGIKTIDPKWISRRLGEIGLKVGQLNDQSRGLTARNEALAAAKARVQQIEADRKQYIDQRAAEVRNLIVELAAIQSRIEDFENAETATDVRAIMAAVLLAHPGITMRDIRGLSRSRPIAAARQHICYELRRLRGLSFPHIAKIVRRTDHSTIIHAVNAWPAKAAQLGIECLPLGYDRSAA